MSVELIVFGVQVDLIRLLFKWIRQLGVFKGSGCYGGVEVDCKAWILIQAVLVRPQTHLTKICQF